MHDDSPNNQIYNALTFLENQEKLKIRRGLLPSS